MSSMATPPTCGADDPSAPLPTAVPFSLDDFMDGFNGWAAKTPDTAETSAGSFFPAFTSDSPEAESDNMSFDFASFFFNNAEQQTVETESEDAAKNKPAEEDRVCDNSTSCRGTPRPSRQNLQAQQRSDVAETERNEDFSPPPTETHGDASLRLSSHGTARHVSGAVSSTLSSATVSDAATAQGREAGSLKRLTTGAKNLAALPFTELSLSAALAAASAPTPSFVSARTPAVNIVNEKARGSACAGSRGNEEEESRKLLVRGENASEAAVGDCSDQPARNMQCTTENEEADGADRREERVRAPSDDEEAVAHAPVSDVCSVATQRPLAESVQLQPTTLDVTTQKCAATAAPSTATQRDRGSFVAAASPPSQPPHPLRRPTPDTEDRALRALSGSTLATLVADAQRACAHAATAEAASRPPSLLPHHRGSEDAGRDTSVASLRREGSDATAGPAHDVVDRSDAVFSAEAAQMQKRMRRLSEETARTGAEFQSKTADLLRMLGPHAGLASMLHDGYTATPVVHLMPSLIAELEDLLKDESEGEETGEQIEAEEPQRGEDHSSKAAMDGTAQGAEPSPEAS